MDANINEQASISRTLPAKAEGPKKIRLKILGIKDVTEKLAKDLWNVSPLSKVLIQWSFGPKI